MSIKLDRFSLISSALVGVLVSGFGCGDTRHSTPMNPVDSTQQSLVTPSSLTPQMPTIAQVNTARMAVPSLTENAVRWNLNDDNVRPTKALHLHVELDGETVINRRFDDAATLELPVPKKDGLYRWRLVRQPALDENAVAELRKARIEGDQATITALTKSLKAAGTLPTLAEQRRNVDAGTFRVLNGRLVNAQQTEHTKAYQPVAPQSDKE